MSSYLAQAGWHAGELLEFFGQDDIEALRADLLNLGVDGWREWEIEHREEANGFLRATRAQREKKKRWQEPAHKRRLAFSAYWQARLAIAVLESAACCGPGGGYRETTAAAAMRAFSIAEALVWTWPFGDEPPFDWTTAR
ncbi:MAG: hypothetical protein HYV96_11005 [Opitutae bacterium]|nr:hypothetical protein [Opitutae bacterium]